MEVVVIGINSNNLELRIFFHRFSKDGQKFGFNILFQKLPAVLGAPDYMVLMLIGRVIQGSDSHDYSLTLPYGKC